MQFLRGRLCTLFPTGKGRRGGIIRISSDRDDRMGANISTHKNPQGFKQNPPKSLDQNLTLQKSHAEFLTYKHVKKALNYITRIFETSVLNTQKIPTSKKNFPTQNNLQIENCKPKNILRSSLSLEIQSTPPPFPPLGYSPSQIFFWLSLCQALRQYIQWERIKTSEAKVRRAQLNDFPPPSRSLEQATFGYVNKAKGCLVFKFEFFKGGVAFKVYTLRRNHDLQVT